MRYLMFELQHRAEVILGLGALGLVVNILVLWNTIYIDAALAQLRQEGYPIRDEDVARLSPFVHERHINLSGLYSFAVPEAVTRGELRPLRNPNDADAQPGFTFHCALNPMNKTGWQNVSILL